MFETRLLREAESLLAACRARGLKLATAESCTGGLIAGLLTEIPGSSDVVERGFVTYSNEAKIEQLGVPADVIERHGAVSREVAIAMALGALQHSHGQISVAVTGIAGPSGATVRKPVGTVWFALARGQNFVETECMLFPGDRTRIRASATRHALRRVLKLATAAS